MPRLSTPGDYDELIAREARHWAAADHDPENPQLWDDPELFVIALAPAYRHLLARAQATGGPVLELGCGDGDLACDLARLGVRVTGVDLSPERVARAREQAVRLGLDSVADFVTLDLNQAPLPGSGFGAVVAHDALHHILELDRLLDRVSDSLRPDGRLVVSDFIGASAVEKALCGVTLGLLPTLQPYARKWRLRGRFAAWFAGEAAKRAALERGGDTQALHDESPFEGISQESIERRIAGRFDVIERFTFCPFWYHAVPKLRMPRPLRAGLIGAFDRVDRPLHRRGWTRGSYVFMEAARRI